MPRRIYSYSQMSRRLYADRFAGDGVIASGWRYVKKGVKKGGRIKFGGAYYEHESLKPLAKEYVYVHMGDYWQGHVQVFRGAFGATGFFCNALSVAETPPTPTTKPQSP